MRERESQILRQPEERCIHGLPRAWCGVCSLPEPRPRRSRLKERAKRGGRRQPIEGLSLLGTNEGVRNLSPFTKALHICRPTSIKKIEQILARCPELNLVEFPPSVCRRYFGRDSAQARLFKERGITVTSGMWIDREMDLDRKDDQIWEERREFLVNLNPEKREILEKVEVMGFEEVEMLKRYFCLEEPRPPRISFIDLGLQQGFSFSTARTKVLGLLGFLGYPTKERGIRRRVINFRRQFKKALQAEKDAQIRAQYEEFQPLPSGLPSGQWGYFLQLTKIQHQSPERLEGFAQESPRTHAILASYYGLVDGVYHSMEEIGSSFRPPISRERVRQLRNSGLEQLGIITE